MAELTTDREIEPLAQRAELQRAGAAIGLLPAGSAGEFRLGATLLAHNECSFLLWAPKVETVDLHIIHPAERRIRMQRLDRGYHFVIARDTAPGTLYFYNLPAKGDRPDPASRYQPQGVHGPSAVVDLAFEWRDEEWRGVAWRDLVFYELHVGTFTAEGTFTGVIKQLPRLKDLGITAIEIMPVAQFPGSRNWGYDGVFPYAPQNTYGGPAGLKLLVEACHGYGLAVVLDVVYNHFGPEGNYLSDFGFYFSPCHRTPWGEGMNFDGASSDEVRRFFLENALQWQVDYHIDGLRLDAVHAMYDQSAQPFLRELIEVLTARAKELNRPFWIVGESDLNDPRVITSASQGGVGLQAQWNDDFHHSLHVLLTGEQAGYYADYQGVACLGKVLRDGYAFTGQYSKFRKRRHGAPLKHATPRQMVVFSQNHDQIGNRAMGDRLTQTLDLEALRLAAGAVLLSPFTPLLFMGEEYGETSPFQYFTSHSDPVLVEAVRTGRREEFSEFNWDAEVPDPHDPETYHKSKLRPEVLRHQQHQKLFEYYKALLRLRKQMPVLDQPDRHAEFRVFKPEEAVTLFYAGPPGFLVALCFSRQPVHVGLSLPAGVWLNVLNSTVTSGESVPDSIQARAGLVARLALPATSVLVWRKQEDSI